MKTDRNVIVNDTKCATKCLSWTAVFAGALVGVGLSFLLNLFSLAVGISAFATAQDGTTALAVGGLLALAISTIIAMFLAGATAGGLGRSTVLGSPSCHLGSLYGFTTWTVTLIMSVMLAMHMGHFISYTTTKLANPSATMVKQTQDEVASAANTTQDSTQMTVSEDKAAHGLATAAFVTFLLFLIGAISACFGAHCGLKCCCKRETMN
jgi:uncharacterized membrane-anchored protein YitT (DUF2179 family)